MTEGARAAVGAEGGGFDRVDVGCALLVGATCFGLYLRTLTPGLCFPAIDCHELALNSLRLGVVHPSGYPLYTWLAFVFAKVVPIGDPAYRVNLLSAVSGGVGVGLVVLMARTIGLGRAGAVLAGAVLGVSPTLWSQAVITEVYAPNVAMIAVVTSALLAWAHEVQAGRDGAARFALFGLLFGLSPGTHLSNLALAMPFSAFVLLTDPSILRRPREIAMAFAAFLLGLAQFAWLPLRGGVFDQFPNLPPTTIQGVWAYTFGAFAESRFAYPVSILPLRLWSYLLLLEKNFSLVGIGLGAIGMWVMAWRWPVALWLFGAMQLLNALVFMQFSVPDPDAFFLIGFVAWALFIGAGLDGLADAVRWLRLPSGIVRGVVAPVAIAGLALWLIGTARTSGASNDRHADTAAGDFYANALSIVPAGSAVLGARGAFGAGLVYWQRIRGLRPDVTILGQSGGPSRPPDAPLFAAIRMASGRPTPTGRQGYRPRDVPPDARYVPVLFGNAHALTLARVDAMALEAVAPPPPSPALDASVGGLVLVAARVVRVVDAPRPRLHVESWWRRPVEGRFIVSSRAGQLTLESHELGVGRGEPENGGLVHEAFDVVVPSTLRGAQTIRLGVTILDDGRVETRWVDVAGVDLG